MTHNRNHPYMSEYIYKSSCYAANAENHRRNGEKGLSSNSSSSIPRNMISEVANALCITYMATEYTLASERAQSSSSSPWWQSRANVICLIVVVLINIVDRVSGASVLVNEVFQGVLHAPKILFCAAAYVFALFVDCRRVLPSLTVKSFSRHVGAAFCRVAPAYPILAVLISFVFMFIISAFEHLHLPLEWLNWPIYYGTLYGPFSFMYLIVKRRVIQDYFSLPTMNINDGPYVTNEELLASANGAENPSFAAAMKRRQASSTKR